MPGEDLQGQILVELLLSRVQTLQGLQLDEGLRACAESPVHCGAEGEQGVDLHHGDDVLVLTQVKGFKRKKRKTAGKGESLFGGIYSNN